VTVPRDQDREVPTGSGTRPGRPGRRPHKVNWEGNEMSVEEMDVDLRDEIREIVAAILEVDVERVSRTSNFRDELEADSLQGIEILSGLERRFHITIEQGLLADMRDVQSTYEVIRGLIKHVQPHGT
jgi:acyl carrier protein